MYMYDSGIEKDIGVTFEFIYIKCLFFLKFFTHGFWDGVVTSNEGIL